MSTLAPLALIGALASAAVLAGAWAQRASRAGDTELTSSLEPAGSWSAPVALSRCPAEPGAKVVFPSDSPSQATGLGAIVWSATPSCPGGAGARVAAIGTDDLPDDSTIPRTAAGVPLAPRGELVAGGAPHGQILIGGAAPQVTAGGLLIQGGASGPFSTLSPTETSSTPIALATAYLGDVALASPPADGASAGKGLRVLLERFFARRLAPLALSGVGAAPVQAVTLAMDYRSEVLLVWAQGGTLYARLLPASGAPRPVQRLARIGPHATIAALLSDDRRGIVAWAVQSGSETSVYLDRSATGVRFGAPERLERFSDPDELASPGASPALVRLSSESVLLAWAGSSAGHWVVHTAPVDLSGLGTVGTIAAPGSDALLAGLAAGPLDDALVLWTQPLPGAAGAPDTGLQEIFAAHGFDLYPPARAVFGEPELVAPPGPATATSVAFDPDSDRSVAAWQGGNGAIEYSVRN
jgi:hypothetical protein